MNEKNTQVNIYQISLSINNPKEEYLNQEEFKTNSDQYNDNNSKDKSKNKVKLNGKNYQKDKEQNNKNVLDLFNKNDEIKKEGKKLGRKRLHSDEKGKHNKFSDDNLRKKCKHIILNSIFTYINTQIKKIYNGNIGNGIFKKELKTVNQSQKVNVKIDFDNRFLNKKIGDIFSENISTKYKILNDDYNKSLINTLRNEKDEQKSKYFNQLFDINFTQCLKHFRGENLINELEGLKCFNDIKDDIIKKYPKDGEEYIEHLKYYINNFETIINNKRSRSIYKK